MAGIGRLIGAVLGSGVMFTLYAFVLPIAVMVVTLYIVRVIPLAGRWRQRPRDRDGAAGDTRS